MSEHWLGTSVPFQTHRERPKGMGLHICAVVPQHGPGLGSEYVEIVNDGTEPATVTGLKLTDSGEHHEEHVYTFPQGDLAAGTTAYVYSGSGTNQCMPNGDFVLYAGLPAAVWKDESHVAQLSHPDGKLIDTMRTGHPARHPDGH